MGPSDKRGLAFPTASPRRPKTVQSSLFANGGTSSNPLFYRLFQHYRAQIPIAQKPKGRQRHALPKNPESPLPAGQNTP